MNFITEACSYKQGLALRGFCGFSPHTSKDRLKTRGFVPQGNLSLRVDGLRGRKDEAAARVFSAAAVGAQAAQPDRQPASLMPV